MQTQAPQLWDVVYVLLGVKDSQKRCKNVMDEEEVEYWRELDNESVVGESLDVGRMQKHKSTIIKMVCNLITTNFVNYSYNLCSAWWP